MCIDSINIYHIRTEEIMLYYSIHAFLILFFIVIFLFFLLFFFWYFSVGNWDWDGDGFCDGKKFEDDEEVEDDEKLKMMKN